MENSLNTEGTDNSFKQTMLLSILRESFLHWRHIENLRQGFTAVWAAIVAGVLAFMSQIENSPQSFSSIPALIFLAFITSLGFLMSWRLSNNIKPCEYNIKEILKRVAFEEYDPTKGWETGITKHFRLRRIFVLTYFVTLIFLISLIILVLTGTFKQN